MIKITGRHASFTLVEALISAMIFVLVLLFSTALLRRSLASFEGAFERSAGLSRSQAKMEEARAASFAEVSLIGERSFDDGKGSIKVSPVSSDLILIEVNYSPRGAGRSIELSTLRSKY